MIAFKNYPIAALALLLAACGGSGGGGSIASTPAPLTTPTPIPTPGFTPTVVPTQTFVGMVAAIDNVRNTRDVLAGPSQVSVGRDDQGNYVVTLPVLPVLADGSGSFMRTFQFDKANAETTSDGVTHYRVGVSRGFNPAERSYLTIIPAASSRNSLQHVNFAFLGACFYDTCADSQFPGGEMYPAGHLLAFGNATAGGEIPVSGLATYSGSFESSGGPVQGGCGDDTCIPNYTAGHLVGGIMLRADFGSKAITGQLSNITDTTGYFSNSATDALRHIPDFALTGQLGPSGTLAGTLTATPGTSFTDGRWTAAFFGPNAAEIGGTMILNSSLSDFSGYFGVKKN
jgi:hypothetical protein